MGIIHILVFNFNIIFMKIIGIIFALIAEFVSGDTHTELIPNITNPQQIFWRDSRNVVLVKDMDIFELDVFTNEMKNIGSKEPNDFVGLDENGNISLCNIEHVIIDSMDDFSTIFRINGKELKFFPTIRPISFEGDTILAVTALDFLEQHYYEISVSEGSIVEIKNPEEEEENDNLYIEEDIFGNVYLNYNIREIVMSHISRHLSNLISIL